MHGRLPSSLTACQAGYHPLHCSLSDSELDALAKLFNEYKGTVLHQRCNAPMRTDRPPGGPNVYRSCGNRPHEFS